MQALHSPYPEEVLVPSEDGGLGVGVDLGVHVGLPHPGGEGLRVGEGKGRLVLVLRPQLVLRLLRVVCK